MPARRPYEPPNPVTLLESSENPFFSWTLTAPPSAFRPKTGLAASIFTDLMAAGGIKSQFTVSPKASLKRAPFTYTARPCAVPATGDAVKPRNRTSGWKPLPSTSLIEAEGTFARMAPVRLGMPVRLISWALSTRVAVGTRSRATSDPGSGVIPTTTICSKADCSEAACSKAVGVSSVACTRGAPAEAKINRNTVHLAECIPGWLQKYTTDEGAYLSLMTVLWNAGQMYAHSIMTNASRRATVKVAQACLSCGVEKSSAVFALYKKGGYDISVDARVGARQPDRELLTGHRRHTCRHGRYR